MSWVKIYVTYHRFSGSWAFLGHRLSGLALTGYLFMHIWTLKGLQRSVGPSPSPEALAAHPWTEFVRPYTSGVWLFLEWVLFSAVLFHAFNGIRIALVDLAGGSKYQKGLFWGFVVLGAVLFLGMGALIYRHVLFGA